MKIYMGSTRFTVKQSLSDVTEILHRFNATAITQEYDPATKEINGLTFTVPVRGQKECYRLPLSWDGIFTKIQAEYKRASSRTANAKSDMELARRIAWRQLFMWLQANFALLDLSMVEPGQALMPYLLPHQGAKHTAWEVMAAGRYRELGANTNSDATAAKGDEDE